MSGNKVKEPKKQTKNKNKKTKKVYLVIGLKLVHFNKYRIYDIVFFHIKLCICLMVDIG